MSKPRTPFMKNKQTVSIALLRAIALAEGSSFLLLLFIAMPLKYLAGKPLAVEIVGAIHGGLFLLYVAAALIIGSMLKWKWTRIAFALVSSVLPFGPFIFEAQLRKALASEN
jgi:integral membrane protein